jgi:phosphoribosylpyrophosphate synthetase
MRVLSLCEYYAEDGGLAPDHFGPWNVVHAIKKDKKLRGFKKVQINGRTRTIEAGSENVAIEWAAEELVEYLDDTFSQTNIAIVPVPSSSCTSSDDVRKSRTFLLAAQIAARFTGIGFCTAVATPILWWQSVKKKASNGGTRDPERLAKMLKSSVSNRSLVKDRTIVLLDDVVTTGGTLIACYEYLAARKYEVSDRAIAVARTVHVKGTAFRAKWEGCPRADDRPAPF